MDWSFRNKPPARVTEPTKPITPSLPAEALSRPKSTEPEPVVLAQSSTPQPAALPLSLSRPATGGNLPNLSRPLPPSLSRPADRLNDFPDGLSRRAVETDTPVGLPIDPAVAATTSPHVGEVVGHNSLAAEAFIPIAGFSSQRLPVAKNLTGFSFPFKFDSHHLFKLLIMETLAHRVGDIFLQPGKPVCAAIDGKMTALSPRVLDDSEIKNMLKWTTGRDTAVTDIMSGKAVNAPYEVFDPIRLDDRGAKIRYRYRVNASPILYWGAVSAQIVIRAIDEQPPVYDQIGLSLDIVRHATPRDGIVLVAGATGSGKTTTYAAIMRYILENDTPIKGNLITHEEPIEFTYDSVPSSHSILVQSQIPTHFPSFSEANREAMRRKPALIMIGELRDEETIRAAVEASLTGHPVFGTVHAVNVAAVMRRLISRFPTEDRATAIFDLVETSRFIMAQRLVPSKSGKRIAAREYLVFDDFIRDQLLDLSEMGRVTSRIKELVISHGHSFEKEAKRLLEEDLITPQVARDLSNV